MIITEPFTFIEFFKLYAADVAPPSGTTFMFLHPLYFIGLMTTLNCIIFIRIIRPGRPLWTP
jgi:hypothetical protein